MVIKDAIPLTFHRRRALFTNLNKIQSIIPEDQNYITVSNGVQLFQNWADIGQKKNMLHQGKHSTVLNKSLYAFFKSLQKSITPC